MPGIQKVVYHCKTVFTGLVKRKTLVLDLDETLIHSHHDGYEMPLYTFQYPKLHNDLLKCGVKLCSCL